MLLQLFLSPITTITVDQLLFKPIFLFGVATVSNNLISILLNLKKKMEILCLILGTYMFANKDIIVGIIINIYLLQTVLITRRW